jgi:hypothetical protein
MNDKQRTYGQYETPHDVADLLLGFCLRRPDDRLLDPSCGTGAFLNRAEQMQRWLAPGMALPDKLWGVELDAAAAAKAQENLPQARIINRNFFRLSPPVEGAESLAEQDINQDEKDPQPLGLFDGLVGNPPYTRAEWIGRIRDDEHTGQQLRMFADSAIGQTGQETEGGHPILSRRAGLHAYFFIHGTGFLREGGRFGFVVPNSWLDIGYGERLKRYLLDHYKILAIIESSSERWFADAKVNTCLVVLEKSSEAAERAANRVRFVRILKPLEQLLPFPAEDAQRLSEIERLVTRLLPSRDVSGEDLAIRVSLQKDLRARQRWGVLLRAPDVYLRHTAESNLVPMSKWTSIRRGYTSGANRFFYLDEEMVEQWQIEPRFLRPLMKSLRHTKKRQVTEADCRFQVFSVPNYSDLNGTAAADYIAWGESQGINELRTCAARDPWYGLPTPVEAQMLLPKGIWKRHFAPLLSGDIAVDQQLYALHLADGVDPRVAVALLNSAWFFLQMELGGRINFGEGVLWLATYELGELRLPDPRYLPPEQQEALVAAFEPLLEIPVGNIQSELADPHWIAFNMLACAVIGFSALEATAINEALLERVSSRQLRAAA